jgi:hypothetical protein
VAGDSDTDIAMLKDALDLKLVLNRNKLQAMCNAYANHGGTWIMEPMFIKPRAKLQSGYDCPNGKDHNGEQLVDEAGQPIPFQEDTRHG